MPKSHPFRFVTPAICGLVAIASLLMGSAALAAQNPPSAPVVKDPKSATRERQDREATLRSAEVEAALDNAKPRRVQVDVEQIKQDFKRIQIIRNEIAHIVLTNQPLNYKAITEKAEAVNKSANRLKAHLVPRTPEQKPAIQKDQAEFNQAEMKGALVRLCKLIDRFVESPALKNPDVTDAQQAIRAGNDLLSIIELSSHVRRSAEKLRPSR